MRIKYQAGASVVVALGPAHDLVAGVLETSQAGGVDVQKGAGPRPLIEAIGALGDRLRRRLAPDGTAQPET